MKQKQGFTVVELIVVIVVIAILATIGIVSYSWITSEARDTARRAAAKELQKAAASLAVRKHLTSWGTTSGRIDAATGLCPMPSGGSGGWSMLITTANNASSNACTVGDMLIRANMLPNDFFDKIPVNEEHTTAARTNRQMIGECRNGSNDYGIYLYYYVKTPTDEETALLNDLMTKCGHRASVAKNSYKMRGVIKIR